MYVQGSNIIIFIHSSLHFIIPDSILGNNQDLAGGLFTDLEEVFQYQTLLCHALSHQCSPTTLNTLKSSRLILPLEGDSLPRNVIPCNPTMQRKTREKNRLSVKGIMCFCCCRRLRVTSSELAGWRHDAPVFTSLISQAVRRRN